MIKKIVVLLLMLVFLCSCTQAQEAALTSIPTSYFKHGRQTAPTVQSGRHLIGVNSITATPTITPQLTLTPTLPPPPTRSLKDVILNDAFNQVGTNPWFEQQLSESEHGFSLPGFRVEHCYNIYNQDATTISQMRDELIEYHFYLSNGPNLNGNVSLHINDLVFEPTHMYGFMCSNEGIMALNPARDWYSSNMYKVEAPVLLDFEGEIVASGLDYSDFKSGSLNFITTINGRENSSAMWVIIHIAEVVEVEINGVVDYYVFFQGFQLFYVGGQEAIDAARETNE